MQEILFSLFSNYPILAPIIFIIVRSLAIIIPPIPGILIDLPGIITFGWFWGFIYAEIGIMLGAMIAFSIARRFREPIVRRISSLQKIEEWENKLSENQKFWTLVAIRLPTNALFDYISYAAGFTKISFVKFFFSTLLGNIPSVFLVFYFGGLSFQKGIYYSITFLIALFIMWIVLGKTKLIKRVS